MHLESRILPCGQTDRRTDGRIDITKLTVSFRNFANAPINRTYFGDQILVARPLSSHFTDLLPYPHFVSIYYSSIPFWPFFYISPRFILNSDKSLGTERILCIFKYQPKHQLSFVCFRFMVLY